MKKQELINKLIHSSTRIGVTDIEKSEYFPHISSLLDQIATLEYEKISVELSNIMVLNINFILNPHHHTTKAYSRIFNPHSLESNPHNTPIKETPYTIMISYPLISSHVADMKEGECVYTIAKDKEVLYSDCVMFSEVIKDLYSSTHQVAIREMKQNNEEEIIDDYYKNMRSHYPQKRKITLSTPSDNTSIEGELTPQQMLEYLDKNKPSQEAINEYNKYFGKSVNERREIMPEEVFSNESAKIIEEYIKQYDYNRSLKQRIKTWIMKMKYKLQDLIK